MSTSENDIVNKPSKDPIDQMIFEKNVRIKNVVPVKEEDSLIVFVNNGINISIRLSAFPRLKSATQEELNNWSLIANGIGIEWPALDEDLSLKGLIQQFSTEIAIKFMTGGENSFAIAA
jgi:hypothetical protein